MALGSALPTRLGFYTGALQETDLIGEFRRIAPCCINLWRFAEHRGEVGELAAARRAARRWLLELLRGNDDLHKTLLDDEPEAMKRILV